MRSFIEAIVIRCCVGTKGCRLQRLGQLGTMLDQLETTLLTANCFATRFLITSRAKGPSDVSADLACLKRDLGPLRREFGGVRAKGDRRLAKHALAALVFFVTAHHAFANTGPTCYGTFSSLQFNAEAGDLSGMEVRIVPTPTGPKASIQIAEGEPGPLEIVDVHCDGTTIRFKIPDGAGGLEAEFSGHISRSEIVGTLKYSHRASQYVSLPRKPGYWDTP